MFFGRMSRLTFATFKALIDPKRPSQKPLPAIKKLAFEAIKHIAELFKDTTAERVFPAAVYKHLRERYGLDSLVDQAAHCHCRSCCCFGNLSLVSIL